ncbi:MAG: Ig-like domain-containing protein, partial [Dehalococcoidia bacterium]
MSLVRFCTVIAVASLAVLVADGAGDGAANVSKPLGAQQLGGPVFVSGDDAEDHCDGTNCGGLMVAALKSSLELSRSPGEGILAIGMTDVDNVAALNSWNNPANGGLNASITTVSGSAIDTVDFADYEVIFVPSHETDGGDPVGITNADIARLNDRQADIVNFVNNLGGGLIALTEQDADPNIAFGFLPIPLEFMNVDYIDVSPTPALAALAPLANSANMDHDNWHNIWTGPPGFSGLEVLAVTPEVMTNGSPAAAILGGSQVVLRGQLDLTPDFALNAIGSEHTLTATITDPLDDGPVPDVDVTFEVTDGPNAGTMGEATTDENGMASFSYTGNDTGTDTIQACFTDQNDDERCDVATKDWGLQKGDDQCDKDVDAVDALQNLRHIAAFTVNQSDPCLEIGSEFASIFADMDCDEDVDAVDALHILRFVADLPSLLPQECAPVGSPL